MNKLFNKVIELDKAINKAFEENNADLEYELYKEQCDILLEIEEKGLREQFDDFIRNCDC